MRGKVAIFALCALLPLAATAADGKKAAPPDPTRDPVMITAGFLSGHPDLRYRLLGMEKRRQDKLGDALKFFQRAAFYADKPSQGMVAEMLWNGQGTPQDRALAYAWMDLAAERGYVGFLGMRERYWSELSEDERKRAIDVGQALYAKYGDAAAKPRIATAIRRERLRMTGSRTGFTGNLEIFVPSPGGGTVISGSKFYDKRYWDPEQYQQWHDAIWAKPRIGRVDVGAVETVKTDAPPPKSRVPETAPQADAPEPEIPDETSDGTPGRTPGGK